MKYTLELAMLVDCVMRLKRERERGIRDHSQVSSMRDGVGERGVIYFCETRGTEGGICWVGKGAEGKSFLLHTLSF